MFYIIDPEAMSADGPYAETSDVVEEFERRDEDDREDLLVLEIDNETNVPSLREVQDFLTDPSED